MRRGRRGTTVSSKVATKEQDKIDAVFNKYKDEGENHIGPEGVEAFCKDLGVDPADRKVLLLAWKMGAQRMGYFTCAELGAGMRAVGATSLTSLRNALPGVEAEVEDADAFSSFYAFAFTYCLMEPRQKIVDIDTAVQMLSICVPAGTPHLADFMAFLQQQKDYRAINQDQWMCFLRFTREVEPSCSDYDESQAWPLLMDNYVEWKLAAKH